MKDFLSSFFSAANDRIKNPFFGAFILSWIAINWKIIIYLIWGDPNDWGIIDMVEAQGVLYLVILPALFAIAYIYLTPWLTHGIQILRSLPLKKSRSYKISNEAEMVKISKEYEANNLLIVEKKRKDFELDYKNKELDLEERRNDIKVEKKLEELEIEKKALQTQKEEFSKRNTTIDKLEDQLLQKNETISKLQADFNSKVQNENELLLEKDERILKLEQTIQDLSSDYKQLKFEYSKRDNLKENLTFGQATNFAERFPLLAEKLPAIVKYKDLKLRLQKDYEIASIENNLKQIKTILRETSNGWETLSVIDIVRIFENEDILNNIRDYNSSGAIPYLKVKHNLNKILVLAELSFEDVFDQTDLPYGKETFSLDVILVKSIFDRINALTNTSRYFSHLDLFYLRD